MHKQMVALLGLIIALIGCCQAWRPSSVSARKRHAISIEPIAQLLGANVTTKPYNKTGFKNIGGEKKPIQYPQQLQCTFEVGCCWLPDEAELAWTEISGIFDVEKFKLIFQSTEIPEGSFLATGSLTARDPTEQARFFSCSIPCSTDDIIVSMRQWKTPGIILNVCMQDSFQISPLYENCQTISDTNGIARVTLPKSDFIDIVIIASSMTNPDINAAIIDDLTVFIGDICVSDKKLDDRLYSAAVVYPITTDAATTTIPQTTSTIVRSLSSPVTLSYTFEDNTLRGFIDWKSNGKPADSSFTLQSGKFGNCDTGVLGPPQGSTYYVGTKLSSNYQWAVLESPMLPVAIRDRTVCFMYYKAAQDIMLKVCLNGKDSCLFETESGVNAERDRQWRSGSSNIPADVNRVYFVALSQGDTVGYVGLDNIFLIDADTSCPATSSESVNACI